MYGVVAAWIATKRPNWWNNLTRYWPLGVVAGLITLTSIALNVPFDRGRYCGGLLLWPLMGVGFALLLPKCSRWTEGSGWAAETARFTARISYALYLCHALVLLVISRMFSRKSAWYFGTHTPSWSIVGITLSVLIAWVVYKWFEKPIMDRGTYYRMPRGGQLDRSDPARIQK
jgi:peptidoglycan/LPS O-acetylase OafA/YrhL